MTSEGINIVALFVEKRRVIGWYAKINELTKQTRQAMSPGGANTSRWHTVPFFRVCKFCNLIH